MKSGHKCPVVDLFLAEILWSQKCKKFLGPAITFFVKSAVLLGEILSTELMSCWAFCSPFGRASLEKNRNM